MESLIQKGYGTHSILNFLALIGEFNFKHDFLELNNVFNDDNEKIIIYTFLIDLQQIF